MSRKEAQAHIDAQNETEAQLERWLALEDARVKYEAARELMIKARLLLQGAGIVNIEEVSLLESVEGLVADDVLPGIDYRYQTVLED